MLELVLKSCDFRVGVLFSKVHFAHAACTDEPELTKCMFLLTASCKAERYESSLLTPAFGRGGSRPTLRQYLPRGLSSNPRHFRGKRPRLGAELLTN